MFRKIVAKLEERNQEELSKARSEAIKKITEQQLLETKFEAAKVPESASGESEEIKSILVEDTTSIGNEEISPELNAKIEAESLAIVQRIN